MSGARPTNSPWRWFPAGLIGAMAAVIVVNASMITLALRTFPGAAGDDSFDTGQIYNQVLAVAAQQAALGWRVGAGVGADRRPTLRPVGRDGAPLSDAVIQASVQRPVGPEQEVALTFDPAADGTLRAREMLAPGQWTMTVAITRAEQRLTTTERLQVR